MEKDYEEMFLDMLANWKTDDADFIREAYSTANMMVNNYSFDRKGYADRIMENPKAKKTFHGICGDWINNFATNPTVWQIRDDRNQLSLERAKILNRSNIDSLIFQNTKSQGKYEKFIRLWMSDSHKTLQQTFSCVIFCFVDRLYYNKLDPELKLKENWWRLPLI